MQREPCAPWQLGFCKHFESCWRVSRLGKWAVDGSRNMVAIGVQVPECFHMLSLIFLYELKYHLSQPAVCNCVVTLPFVPLVGTEHSAER